ncbi:MAG: pentapeptide repeat-containing protein [Methylocella sp.]
MSDKSDEPESKAGEQKPPKIKAEDNPWYLLATLCGVPESGDDQLREKNRIAWNRYFAANLDEETRTKFIEERHPAEELTPYSPEELREIETAFAECCKASARKPALPASSAEIDFSNIKFEKPVFFVGYLFSIGCCFESATFSRGASFTGATFTDGANLLGATFTDVADFLGATFSGMADFRDATFSGMADFSGTTFSDEANFIGATFSGAVDFLGAIFSGAAYFLGMTFSGMADFSGAIFYGAAHFHNPTFSDTARFDGATFSDWAGFDGVTFSDEADFHDTTFSGVAAFTGATFSDEAHFDRASFSGRAAFDGATFSGSADFDGASFSGRAFFDGATFSGPTNFGRATFGEASNFVNAEMKEETLFDDAIFETEPPRFLGAKLHQGTVWYGITWPPVPEDKRAARFSIDAYACLKLEMDRLKKHEDELDFFALELQSRRVLLGPWRGLPIALYGLVSDYGRSYARPFVWLLVVAAIGALLFVFSDALPIEKSFGLSFANTLNVFGFRKDFFDTATIEHLPASLKILTALQTILGAILLFLFGLGIRNKFRMK